MNKLYLLLVLFIFAPSSYAENGGYVYPLQHGKTYIQSHFEATLNIKLYDNPKLENAPIMELNASALFYKNEILCHWENGSFDSDKPDDQTLAGCRADSPVIVTWGDLGVGGAALFIRYNRINDEILETDYLGQKLYFSLKSLPKPYEKYRYDANAKAC